MRERIAEIILEIYADARANTWNGFLPNRYADKILALLPSLDGIEAVEKCPKCHQGIKAMNVGRDGHTVYCGVCHGTGEIVRAVTWSDIEWDKKWLDGGYLIIPTKGRLRVKEKA